MGCAHNLNAYIGLYDGYTLQDRVYKKEERVYSSHGSNRFGSQKIGILYYPFQHRCHATNVTRGRLCRISASKAKWRRLTIMAFINGTPSSESTCIVRPAAYDFPFLTSYLTSLTSLRTQHILLTEALYVRRSKAYDFKTREDGEDYWIVLDPWGDLGSFLHLMSSIFSSLFETTCFSSKLPEMTPTNVAGTW
jgi:hypothetical protein